MCEGTLPVLAHALTGPTVTDPLSLCAERGGPVVHQSLFTEATEERYFIGYFDFFSSLFYYVEHCIFKTLLLSIETDVEPMKAGGARDVASHENGYKATLQLLVSSTL